MIVSLYAGLSDFAMPTPAKTEGGEDQPVEKNAPNSLFERVNAEPGATRVNPPSHDGDAAVLADRANWAALTAGVKLLGLSSSHAEANLTDGYQLHEFQIDNMEAAIYSPVSSSRLAEMSSDTSSRSASAILPAIELDFSSDESIPQATATNSARQLLV